MRVSGPQTEFARVRAAGCALAGVEAGVKYDGSPVLRLEGCFLAGMATHSSAEPDSIVVRMDLADRAALLDEAPDTYYVTEYYQRHPVVLARLARLDANALRDLLQVSRRLTVAKVGSRGARDRRASATATRGRAPR